MKQPADLAAGGPVRESTVTDHRWRTTLSASIRAEDLAGRHNHAAAIFAAEVEALEAAASRFREDSQLSEVNRAAGKWTPVSQYFAEVLAAGIEAADITDGLTSPCLGTHVDAAGYRSWSATDAAVGLLPEIQTKHRPSNHWREIAIRQTASGVEVRTHPDSQLDLGATAKAWLADRVAERIASELDVDVLANMGGDLRAIGAASPWVVGVDVDVPELPVRAIEIWDGGLATSSRARRRWTTSTGIAHHIIDPRTGRPAVTRWWSVTVLASTATAANTVSTAAMVSDDRAPQWVADLDLDAWLIEYDPGRTPRSVRVGRWPALEEVA